MHRSILAAAFVLPAALFTACAPADGDDQASEAALQQQAPQESVCHTDGCVTRKQEEFAAALRWLKSNDDCASVVVWPQSVKKIADGKYVATCGDTHDSTRLSLSVAAGNDGPVASLTASHREPSATPNDSPCRTDGCVERKQAEFEAVLLWIASNDDCASVVAWPQSVAKRNGSDFDVVCGDTSDREKIVLRVKNPAFSTQAAEIKVERVN
jgi:hypothetical protein